ncbi:hypothetical protein, partial [Mesorhizobium sp. B3-1-9]|uniref:hypothetical protein n=1 Tax=Mesorhizobium sp. B3-1-9 TaxID=2589892 RepID=UPI001AEE40C7
HQLLKTLQSHKTKPRRKSTGFVSSLAALRGAAFLCHPQRAFLALLKHAAADHEGRCPIFPCC